MRRWTITAIAVAIAMPVPATPSPAPATSGTDPQRLNPDFLYMSTLFPVATGIDPDIRSGMNPAQIDFAKQTVQTRFGDARADYFDQRSAILKAVSDHGTKPIRLTDPSAAQITFEDDGNPWSNTISPNEIRVGARLVRGLMLGALHEARVGDSPTSVLLKSIIAPGLGEDPSDAQIEGAIRTYIDAIRYGKIAISAHATDDAVMEVMLSLRSNLGDTNDVSPPALAYARGLNGRLGTAAAGGELSSEDQAVLQQIQSLLWTHYDPAEFFMLAHELGHVVLGHAPFPENLTCSERQRREDDADAFAMATLVYGMAGDQALGTRAFTKLMSNHELEDDGYYRLMFGYEHAVKYGFALAGLDNVLVGTCHYRQAADRVAMLDSLRKDLMQKRIAAAEALWAFMRRKPPYLTTTTAQPLSPAEHKRILDAFSHRCGQTIEPAAFTIENVSPSASKYTLLCKNRLDKPFKTRSFQAQLGPTTVQAVERMYSDAQALSTIGSFIVIDMSVSTVSGGLHYSDGEVRN